MTRAWKSRRRKLRRAWAAAERRCKREYGVSLWQRAISGEVGVWGGVTFIEHQAYPT